METTVTDQRRSDPIEAVYREAGAGGYSHVDGTIEFYGRVRAVCPRHAAVLDFGAGRAGWYEDDPCAYRRNLRDLRGCAPRVVACDIDEAVLDNRASHEAIVLKAADELPFDASAFDVVVADYVFEHVSNPRRVAAEIQRVLRPGGWLCARTPYRYSYPGIITSLLPNRVHAHLLRKLQPSRNAVDVFPTTYLLNTRSQIRKHFREFHDFSYLYEAEPPYFLGSAVALRALRILHAFLPRPLTSQLFVFAQKPAAGDYASAHARRPR